MSFSQVQTTSNIRPLSSSMPWPAHPSRCPAPPPCRLLRLSSGTLRSPGFLPSGRRLPLLDLLPAQAAGRDKRGGRAADGDEVRVAQALEVGGQHGGQVLRGVHLLQDLGDLGGAAVDEDLGRQAWGVALDALGEAVLEDGLGDGDEDGAAQGLEELHAGGGLGDPLVRDAVLDDEHARLEADADAQPREDLVAEPDAQRAVEGEGRDHARADGEEDHGGQDEGVVVADGGDEAAGGHRGDDDGDEHREELDAGLDGAVSLDGLEVQGWVVCFLLAWSIFKGCRVPQAHLHR